MPKKPPRDNPHRRELRTVHNAGAGAALLLQRIRKRAGLEAASEAPGGLLPWVSRLRACLPVEQREHLVDVIARDGALVLLVDSAAWAGRIRLSLPELAAQAAGRALSVKLAGAARPKRRPAGAGPAHDQ